MPRIAHPRDQQPISGKTKYNITAHGAGTAINTPPQAAPQQLLRRGLHKTRPLLHGLVPFTDGGIPAQVIFADFQIGDVGNDGEIGECRLSTADIRLLAQYALQDWQNLDEPFLGVFDRVLVALVAGEVHVVHDLARLGPEAGVVPVQPLINDCTRLGFGGIPR